MEFPRLLWDEGTAYDFFISLEILHNPADFGLRCAWSAGMRARLPADDREILETSQLLFNVPLHWIYSLPEPKDAATILWSLRQIPPAERLPVLALLSDQPDPVVAEMLKRIMDRGTWNDDDRKLIQTVYSRCDKKEKPLTPEEQNRLLDCWANSEEFGERYLKALQSFQEVFFAEEERYIQSALDRALSNAKEMAEKMSPVDLIEEVTQGLRFPELNDRELVLAPSYWSTPLLYYEKINRDRKLFLFGARPPDASLVHGEAIPDLLIRALKAFTCSTRLRILQYLSREPLTPAQLSRRLRLRPPTITHHLKTLRMAGLVQITKTKDIEAKFYATRSKAVASTFESLKSFLEKNNPETIQKALKL